MKAIVYRSYGSPDVLRYEDVDKPTPGDGEVLIRVRAASVNPIDWHFMRGTPYVLRVQAGLRKPKETRLGIDVSGDIQSVGRNVTQFTPGNQVFGTCRGALAEYVCAAESALVTKPDRVTFEQAAAVPVAAFTALQGLRHVQPAQKVLINGAAGGVGTFAVQIAKSLRAEVTGVCSTRNVDMVRSIGADHVIDYTQEDFTTHGLQYDLLFDCVGNHSLSACSRVVTRTGAHLVVGGPAAFFKAFLLSRLGNKRVVAVGPKSNRRDLASICELMEAGKVTPVVDKCYELSEAAEAVRYLETGHARGKVVVTMSGEIR